MSSIVPRRYSFMAGSFRRRQLERRERRRDLDAILGFLAIEAESREDGRVGHHEQDRRLAFRAVDLPVPRPVRDRQRIVLGPLNVALAESGAAFAFDHEFYR